MADTQQTTTIETQQNPEVTEKPNKLSKMAKQSLAEEEDKHLNNYPKSPKMSQKQTFTTTGLSFNQKISNIKKVKSPHSGRDLPFFGQKQQVPGPGFYKNVSIFDSQTAKGAIIHKGPDRNPIDGYINKEALKTPPLTQYYIEDMNRFKSPSFTMGSKFKDFCRVKTEEDMYSNPGPGNYEEKQLFSPQGQNIAGYQNTSSIIYSPRSEKRFFQLKFKTPGPGQYIGLTDLSANGVYISSSASSNGGRYFDKQQRKFNFGNIQLQKKVPGPGQYSVPSQFDKYNKQKDSLVTKKNKKN